MLHELVCIPASLLSPSKDVYFCLMSSSKGVEEELASFLDKDNNTQK